jgi:hypothetical protein
MLKQVRVSKPELGRAVACLSLLLICVAPMGVAAQRNYELNRKISRQVLHNYLNRSITMAELYRSPGNLDDDIRMLQNIGAKFVGRTIYLWGGSR